MSCLFSCGKISYFSYEGGATIYFCYFGSFNGRPEILHIFIQKITTVLALEVVI